MRALLLHRIKTYTEICTSAVTMVAALAGGGWAINEYLDKQQEDRIRTTLEYRRQYDQGALLAARVKIGAAWLEHEEEEVGLLQKGNMSEFSAFIVRVIHEKGLAVDIETLVEFFDVLNACRVRHLCDDATLIDLFGIEATTFAHQHRQYFKLLRERRKDENFAVGIDHIASAAEARQQ